MPRVKNDSLGYLGNPNVKRDGIETEFTVEEVKEYQDVWKVHHTLQKSMLRLYLLIKD